MSLQMKIDGADGFFALRIQQARLEERLKETIRGMSRDYRARVVSLLSAPKTGAFYGARRASIYRRTRATTTLFGGQTAKIRRVQRTSTNAVAYRASAPNEPPAVRTGTLLRSINVKFPARGKGFSARVYAYKPVAFYRHFLEFGAGPARRGRKGRTGFRAARPLWSPLQAKIEQELSGKVLGAVDGFVSGN